MRTARSSVIGAVAIALLAGCAEPTPPAPVPEATTTPAHYAPAPMPSVIPRRNGSTVGQYEIVIPPKAPPGTGAVPVSNSSVRGSIVTGFHESF